MAESRASYTFSDNLDSIWVLHRVAFEQSRSNMEPDVSEIYRAEIVLLVSAFDTYIHDVIADLKTEMLMDNRLWKKNLLCKYGFYPSIAKKIRRESDKKERKKKFRAALLNKLQHYTFQKSKRIAEVFSKCGFSDIWVSVCEYTDENVQQLTKKLDAIVKERDCIAHESHINPATGQKYPMTEKHVEEVRCFLLGIVGKIDQVIEDRNNYQTT